MAKVSQKLLERVPVTRRPFVRHSDTQSRVLIRTGAYSQPIDNRTLYVWLDENMNDISPEVAISLSKAEQARVGR